MRALAIAFRSRSFDMALSSGSTVTPYRTEREVLKVTREVQTLYAVQLVALADAARRSSG
jgi:hypothetical protein